MTGQQLPYSGFPLPVPGPLTPTPITIACTQSRQAVICDTSSVHITGKAHNTSVPTGLMATEIAGKIRRAAPRGSAAEGVSRA